MREKKITISLSPHDPDGICESQTPSGAGALTMNGDLVIGGTAVLDAARNLRISSGSDISNRTFSITGTDRYGSVIVENLTGPNDGTVYTTYDFKTVTGVTISGAAAGAVLVGTAPGAGSKPFLLDTWRVPPITALQVNDNEVAVNGASIEYSIDFTLADPSSMSPGEFERSPKWARLLSEEADDQRPQIYSVRDHNDVPIPVRALRVKVLPVVDGDTSASDLPADLEVLIVEAGA